MLNLVFSASGTWTGKTCTQADEDSPLVGFPWLLPMAQACSHLQPSGCSEFQGFKAHYHGSLSFCFVDTATKTSLTDREGSRTVRNGGHATHGMCCLLLCTVVSPAFIGRITVEGS